jgi:hypothetical protein
VAATTAREWYRRFVAQKHQRFALIDATFAGQPLPNATVDWWEDDQGRRRWAIRALVPAGPLVEGGRLAGKTRDGREVSGEVVVGNQQEGPRGRAHRLVEFNGSGELEGYPGTAD